jgi:hypothetical protein
VQVGPGNWKLTIAERKRILLDNIFGVDIDTQAVETTKLSLLLKVLEGETQQSLQPVLRLFHERALPDLGDNIKCGNSLIGPDFYQQQQMPVVDEEEQYRVNFFDWWGKDGFPAIKEAGGFDAVIGNPPYVRIQGFPKSETDYLTTHYRSATGNCDLYVSFVERGLALLNQTGMFGMITPNKFFRTDYGEGLRRLLSSKRSVHRIVDFGADQVFTATTYTCLLFLQNRQADSFEYGSSPADPASLEKTAFSTRDTKSLSSAAWTFESQETAALLAKLARDTTRLLDLPADMSRGSSTGDDEVFVFERGELSIEAGILRDPLFASDFGRYRFAPAGKWKVIFPYVCEEGNYRLYEEHELKTKFPRAFAHLQAHQGALKQRKQYREWYGYSAPRNLGLHDQAQIAVPLLADCGLFALIPEASRARLCPMASGGFTIALSKHCRLKPEYVLGLLNSKLLFWRLGTMSNLFRGGWITCTKQYFGELPIRNIDFSNPIEKTRHDKIAQLAEQMLTFRQRHSAARTPQEKTALERQIAATDTQLDTLIYALYGLTDAEIKIVEASG